MSIKYRLKSGREKKYYGLYIKLGKRWYSNKYLCVGNDCTQVISSHNGIQGKLRDIDGWVRNRLRYCIWHDWKKPERKRKNLLRLGVDRDHAYAWSRTRKGGWCIAQSPILSTTITLERLRKRGYVSMLEMYDELNPLLNEPPYTRPVRTVV
ncbi:MAG: hypothetical protein U0X41_11030 [Chitinophagales bacterium]